MLHRNNMDQHFYHAHEVIKEQCNASLKCIRFCPTQALRFRNEIIFLSDLCIDCGECIANCPQHVFKPIISTVDDLKSFKYLIAIPSPILYAQFGLNIHPYIVNQALKQIGFNEVADISKTSDELGFALLHHLKTRPDIRPLISSFCPAIVRLIQVKYPNLVGLIEPIDVPREIVAKRTKQIYSEKLKINPKEIGVFYITPCPAIFVSIKQPAEKKSSWIDGAIPIRDIYSLIFPIIQQLLDEKDKEYHDTFHFGKDWSVLNYISRSVGLENCLTVTGVQNAKMVFDDIVSSKLRDIDFIEALACKQGCVGGAFCMENPYIARHNSIFLQKKYSGINPFDKEKVINNYNEGYYFLEHPVLPRPTRSFNPDISISIRKMKQKMRISSKLPQKDCGLCGAPTCDEFAEDCVRGEAEPTDCAFFSDEFKKGRY